MKYSRNWPRNIRRMPFNHSIDSYVFTYMDLSFSLCAYVSFCYWFISFLFLCVCVYIYVCWNKCSYHHAVSSGYNSAFKFNFSSSTFHNTFLSSLNWIVKRPGCFQVQMNISQAIVISFLYLFFLKARDDYLVVLLFISVLFCLLYCPYLSMVHLL